jgi:hypothetical protein
MAVCWLHELVDLMSLPRLINYEYVRRLRRRMLGVATAHDRRCLQQESGEVVATVPLQEVADAVSSMEKDAVPISVTVQVYGIKYTELVAGSGLAVSKEVDEEGASITWYRGLHAQEILVPTYEIRCDSDAE